MAPQDLLLMVFCPVDDELRALGLTRLRSRGPAPEPADSEVIAIERVAELWGPSDDEAIHDFFGRCHAAEFPGPPGVHRTNFARRAANLCWAERRIPRHLAERLAGGGPLRLVDGLPPPARRSVRARTGRRVAGQAAWGSDPVAVEAFYGFRSHLRTGPDGVIAACQLAPADAAETEVIRELAPEPLGVAPGDRNSRSPASREAFEAADGRLVAPFETHRHDPGRRRSARRLRRRRVEHAIGGLVERLGCRRIRVRDVWHPEHRLVRKILSHTAATWLNVRDGHPPLQFARLVG